jgi:uncharacterized protein YcfL
MEKFDYNTALMIKYIFLLTVVLILAGCETVPVYNPVTPATNQTFLVNSSALSRIAIGMDQSQVHEIMGDTLIIGYDYQKPVTDEETFAQNSASDYRPLTIANPYKTEEIKTKEGQYLVEYYVHSVQESDGVVSDDELIPLIFKDGTLVSKGKDALRALRSKDPA